MSTYMSFRSAIGVELKRVRVHAHGEANVWEVLRKLGAAVRDIEVDDSSAWVTMFFALPEDLSPGALYLHTTVVAARGEDSSHWDFDLREIPNDQPPDEVTDSSSKVGGYPQVMEHLVELLGTMRLGVSSADATFALDDEKWHPAVGGQQQSGPIVLASGTELPAYRQIWRAKTEDTPVTSIGLGAGTQGHHLLRVEAVPPIDFGSHIMDQASQWIWTEIGPILKRR